MSFFNEKRLRDYPRIFFITMWTILLLSLVLHQGWLNAFDQVIGSDFVTLYAAGLIHRTNLPDLYNFATQAETQQTLIEPTTLPGLNPYISPPYVAAAYSLFTYLPLPTSLFIWSLLSIAFTLGAARFLVRKFPELMDKHIEFWQLVIIILSFFPFIEGFQAGQNHALMLLLVTLMIVFMLSEHWFLAGIMAGMMIYKPQMIIGLLVIWLIWRKFKAVAGFALVSVIGIGIYVIFYGTAPIMDYLSISKDLVLLPYIPGFPGYLLLTIYGLFATILPFSMLNFTQTASTLISIMLLVGCCWLAFRLRNKPIIERTPAVFLAVLLPMLATPYVLLHDSLVLIPLFILWARYRQSLPLLYTIIGTYLGGLLLTLFSTVSKIALVSLMTIGLVILLILFIKVNRHEILEGKQI